METAHLLEAFIGAAMLAVKIATPLLISAVLIGLAVSLFQALTQINESTLAFIPKLFVMALVMWFSLPWIVREMVTFTTHMFETAAGVTR